MWPMFPVKWQARRWAQDLSCIQIQAAAYGHNSPWNHLVAHWPYLVRMNVVTAVAELWLREMAQIWPKCARYLGHNRTWKHNKHPATQTHILPAPSTTSWFRSPEWCCFFFFFGMQRVSLTALEHPACPSHWVLNHSIAPPHLKLQAHFISIN